MKRILHDTGNLRVARWLLQRALKFYSEILAEKGLPTFCNVLHHRRFEVIEHTKTHT